MVPIWSSRIWARAAGVWGMRRVGPKGSVMCESGHSGNEMKRDKEEYKKTVKRVKEGEHFEKE